jgi:hypothetical protein
MSDEKNLKKERLYSAKEVKTKGKISFTEGLLAGAVAALAAGVVLSKTAKINITDATTGLADKGIEKIKGIPKKFKKQKEEE